MKKYLYSLLAGSIVILLAWTTGFDFNTRGIDLFMTTYLTLAVTLGTFLFISVKDS